jgi:hypothetical protein
LVYNDGHSELESNRGCDRARLALIPLIQCLDGVFHFNLKTRVFQKLEDARLPKVGRRASSKSWKTRVFQVWEDARLPVLGRRASSDFFKTRILESLHISIYVFFSAEKLLKTPNAVTGGVITSKK